MPLLNFRVRGTDDRGKTVPIGALSNTPHSAGVDASNEPGLADLRMRVVQMIKPDNMMRQRVTRRVLLWLLAGTATIVVPQLLASNVPGVPFWMPMICSAIVMSFIVREFVFRQLSKESPRIITAFLCEGRCPSCAYIIAGTPADADGCITCPECAAAWLAARVGAPAQAPEQVRRYQRQLLEPTMSERLLVPVRFPLVISDERGQAIHIIDPMLRRVRRTGGSSLDEPRIHRIRSQMRRMHRLRTFVTTPFILLMIIGALMFMRTGLIRGGTGTLLDLVFAIGRVVGFGLVLWTGVGWLYAMFFGDRSFNPGRASRVLLNNLVCPGCCTPLDKVAPDQHGLCECPTCHAAWKVPRHPDISALAFPAADTAQT